MLNHTVFPTRLREHREQAGLSQADVCRSGEIAQAQLSRIEAGKESAVKGVSIKTLVLLANKIGCTADSLLK